MFLPAVSCRLLPARKECSGNYNNRSPHQREPERQIRAVAGLRRIALRGFRLFLRLFFCLFFCLFFRLCFVSVSVSVSVSVT